MIRTSKLQDFFVRTL